MTTHPAEMTVHSSQPYNAEPPRTALAGRDLTPVEAFYHRNHAGERPRIDPAAWSLRVDGMVERPATFSLGALRERFAEHAEVVTLQCAGNRRAGLMEVADLPGETPWGPGATGTARWATALALGIVGAVLLEQNDEWQLQHRYMQIEGMAALATPTIEEVQPLQITPKAA